MSALAASELLLSSPVSPELVLVSPPDVARSAREQLPDPPTACAIPQTARGAGRRALELAAVYLVCLLLTLGPLLLVIVAQPIRPAAAP